MWQQFKEPDPERDNNNEPGLLHRDPPRHRHLGETAQDSIQGWSSTFQIVLHLPSASYVIMYSRFSSVLRHMLSNFAYRGAI
jgi:hypothetical protein